MPLGLSFEFVALRLMLAANVFQANPESGSATDRSGPIGDLAPRLRTAGIDFVNLQRGAAGRRPTAG